MCAPPRRLAEIGVDARQFSPLIPNAQALEDLPDASPDATSVVAAPPGAVVSTAMSWPYRFGFCDPAAS